MIANLLEKQNVKVLTFFLISPGSRYKRKEIQEKTRMPNLTLDSSLTRLEKLGVIRREKNYFSLIFGSQNDKIIENLKEEYLSFNLPYNIFNMLVEISDKLSEVREIKEARLFGSYAKLIYHVSSDIDIAAILKNKVKDIDATRKRVLKIIDKIAKREKKKIEVHLYFERDLKQKDAVIKEINRNGKKIL